MQTADGRLVMVNFYARAHFAAGLHLSMFTAVGAAGAAADDGAGADAIPVEMRQGPEEWLKRQEL